MELLTSDADSVTIRLQRQTEFVTMGDVLRVISLELEAGRIDLERLMSSEVQVEALVEAFFDLPRTGDI